MIIQVFGTKKCKNTQKAVRFFKERKVEIQEIDLKQKGLSKGEIKKVLAYLGNDNLLDKECELYLNKGLKHASYKVEEILYQYPLLLVTPLVRCGNKSAVGYKPDEWKSFLEMK